MLPNIIGCVFWPPFYFLPGILAGAAIDVPQAAQGDSFKWLLLAVALLLWIGGWLLWRWWRSGKSVDWATPYLPLARLLWLAPLMALVGVGCRDCAADSSPADAGFRRDPVEGVLRLSAVSGGGGNTPRMAAAGLSPRSRLAVLPSQYTRPSAITTDRVAQSAAASSILCDTISIVSSCWRWQTSCTSASISWRSAGSSAEKGSSSSSTGCSRTRQRASATR